MSINKALLSGNITWEPELRQTNGGMDVLEFGIAVNERVPDGSGGWKDYANYFKCVLFGKRARGVSRLLAKGMKVFVEGHLRYASWYKDDEKRSSVTVIVDDIVIASKREQTAQPSAQYADQPAAQLATPGTYGKQGIYGHIIDSMYGEEYQDDLDQYGGMR